MTRCPLGFQNHEFSRRIGPRPASSKKSPKWCHFSRESSGWSIGGVQFYEIFSSFLVLNGQIVEFSRARGPDRRVFSCSNARSLNFLVFEGQIVGFSRAQISDRRVFSCSRARSSSFLMLKGPYRRHAITEGHFPGRVFSAKAGGGTHSSTSFLE